MHPIVLPCSSVRLPTVLSFNTTVAKFNFSGKDGSLLISSRKTIFVSGIRSEDNKKRTRRNTSSNKSIEKDEERAVTQTGNSGLPESSNQEEIIALFRRIQSSISKEGRSTNTQKGSANDSRSKKPTESVLQVLRQHRSKNKKDVTSKEPKEDNKNILPQLKGTFKNMEQVEGPSKFRDGIKPEETLNISKTSEDMRRSRPTSSFLKRSPIPPSSNPKNQSEEKKVNVKINEELPVVSSLELDKLDEMKLSELKNFAKSKGVKGYSKMKKGDLIEFLRGLL